MCIAGEFDRMERVGEAIESEKACGWGTTLFLTELEHAWESVREEEGVEVSNMAFRLA